MRAHSSKPRKIIFSIALAVIAVLSITLLSDIFSTPETYARTIETLDDQKQIATTLSIAVTAASTTLSTLPDDTASPIASELANLSTPLFIIVCILFMEKFLLTTFGWVSCTILIPAACLLMILNTFTPSKTFITYVKKLLVLALALIFMIPVSAKVTTHIQETFSESVSQAFDAVHLLADETDSAAGEDANAFITFFTSLKDNVVTLVETAKNMLGVFTDAVAVLLITSCVIPVLTALLFIWIVKMLFAIEAPAKNIIQLASPTSKKLPRPSGRKAG